MQAQLGACMITTFWFRALSGHTGRILEGGRILPGGKLVRAEPQSGGRKAAIRQRGGGNSAGEIQASTGRTTRLRHHLSTSRGETFCQAAYRIQAFSFLDFAGHQSSLNSLNPDFQHCKVRLRGRPKITANNEDKPTTPSGDNRR